MWAMLHSRTILSLLLLALVGACAHSPDRKALSQRIADQFKLADKNGDESLDPEEFKAMQLPDTTFEAVDTDVNGKVTLAEIENYVTWRRVQAEGRRRYEQLRRQDRLPPQ
jgi:Ca2+-binding EF-hand superfamily protein